MISFSSLIVPLPTLISSPISFGLASNLDFDCASESDLTELELDLTDLDFTSNWDFISDWDWDFIDLVLDFPSVTFRMQNKNVMFLDGFNAQNHGITSL